MWPVEVRAQERGLADVRTDPFIYCYLYGLFVHKLAHFHYVNHGTQHFFYMNEIQFEFMDR